MVVEFHMPETAHFALQGIYYVFAVITLLRLEEIQLSFMPGSLSEPRLVANLRCA